MYNTKSNLALILAVYFLESETLRAKNPGVNPSCSLHGGKTSSSFPGTRAIGLCTNTCQKKAKSVEKEPGSQDLSVMGSDLGQVTFPLQAVVSGPIN